jgi:hypothetical protein
MTKLIVDMVFFLLVREFESEIPSARIGARHGKKTVWTCQRILATKEKSGCNDSVQLRCLILIALKAETSLDPEFLSLYWIWHRPVEWYSQFEKKKSPRGSRPYSNKRIFSFSFSWSFRSIDHPGGGRSASGIRQEFARNLQLSGYPKRVLRGHHRQRLESGHD